MVYVYFEKQLASLCGVHCLNSLLQGSYFTAVDLANVAHQLDQEEMDVMSQAGMDTSDFIKFAAEGSGNVADDGFYSVQVLEKALLTFNLTCTSINKQENASVIENPLSEDGFICNLSNHWFTLRKIQGKWFDLNSLKKPSVLSDFYVGLYLETLRQQGWSIFVVRGTYPNIVPFSPAELGMWVDVDPNAPAQQGSRPTPPKQSMTDYDPELEAALKMSLDYADENETYRPIGTYPSNPNDAYTLIEVDENEQLIDDEDEDLKAAIEASLKQS
ncbi:hypothetical protein SAMD00019534_028690 [Acytostelium subglobosum LB1]|uniref:hypothetical protein n=1 Tax=Acytostelium subglobosum LB1 TaxID=1410327 RepID=UPI000644D6F3|nr:hypothetical protein SAMD00019534_028690 [Acytostelium subglobosum LB1]GAM19694.1 hypothetical protein SAMD00019534_028690 [Acytostelium subglobosum LB1]|eukprot:XP_012756456.1 hypothetical protein SAMD00019534_028690 [Acytostelium subglobosum LB1]